LIKGDFQRYWGFIRDRIFQHPMLFAEVRPQTFRTLSSMLRGTVPSALQGAKAFGVRPYMIRHYSHTRIAPSFRSAQPDRVVAILKAREPARILVSISKQATSKGI
jgi:hypothetical protein